MTKLNKIYTSNFVFVNSGFHGRILKVKSDQLWPQSNEVAPIYNLTDNPMCPNCFDVVESTNHFFECASYSVAREIFIDDIEKIIADFNLKSELCRS